MIALVGSVLAASLLGSAHCAGMCGGFVCFYAADGRARAWAHVAYHGGRLLSYVALGLAAGAIGAGVTHAGTMVGVSRGATIVAGALMVLWGGARLLEAFGAKWPARLGRGPTGAGPVAHALRAVAGRPPVERAFVLGLATTLLPCGWLYAFVATAAGTGAPLPGALVMAVFWTGTLPALAAVGLAARGAFGPLSRRLPALTAVAVIVLGALTLAGRLDAPAASARALEASATAPDPAKHDCCQ